jgi:ribonucleoside-diphosphate reductase alpha chain
MRIDMKKHGIRNATLTALMPSETSSQISNATNGIEPPRAFVSVKQSKDGVLKQVVPGIEDPAIKWSYEFLWDQESPKGYLKLVGVMQKFVDQTISANTSYNPNNYKDRLISIKDLLDDLLYAYKLGVKTLYYMNTNDIEDGKQDIIDEDDDCDSCKI